MPNSRPRSAPAAAFISLWERTKVRVRPRRMEKTIARNVAEILEA